MTPEAAQLGSAVGRGLVGGRGALRTVHGHEMPTSGGRRSAVGSDRSQGQVALASDKGLMTPSDRTDEPMTTCSLAKDELYT